VAAVGQLRSALWDALIAATAPLDAASTAALAERLAFVCDLVAVATVGAGRGGALRVRDARGEGERVGARRPLAVVAERADADWRAAAEGHVRDARPFALLVVEVDDAERLLAADAEAALAPDAENSVAGALGRVEDAVRAELRPGDVMGREPDGRLWVVAAELGATGGRALAERLADAVAAAATLRGVPLSASIGLAASPADGTALDTLAAQADEALFAARAAGVPVA
jgi:GGDEF domain-containing protein